MKVGNLADTPATTAPVQSNHASTPATAAKADATAATPVVPDASAKIELSSTASTLLAGGGTPEFDVEKVARLSQAIASGTFRIDAEAIADKLISNASELLTRSQR